MTFTVTMEEVRAMLRSRYGFESVVTIEVVDTESNVADTLEAAQSRVPVHNGTFGELAKFESVFTSSGKIRFDQKIEAIKALREEIPGLGLADSKRAIEDWANFIAYVRKNGIPPISNFRWNV